MWCPQRWGLNLEEEKKEETFSFLIAASYFFPEVK